MDRISTYYSIIEEYLKIFPFTPTEQKEVRTALVAKIRLAILKDDKDAYDELEKRMQQLEKVIDSYTSSC